MNMSHPYPRLARLTLENHLAKNPLDENWPIQVSADKNIWEISSACFVSIKTLAGDLRGCIGTIYPVQPNLGLEIMANSVSAGTQDPRFPPLKAAELDRVSFSVDVLSIPEVVTGPEQLDPAKWGVIVEKDGRRGLLLPDLEGVETVADQLNIAARKAGLPGPQGCELKRFSVSRFPED